MSLQKKIFVVFSVFLLFFIFITVLITKFNLQKEILVLEDQKSERLVLRFENALKEKISNLLNGSAKDWAEWSDIYYFFMGKNKNFPANKISDNQFDLLDLNFMVFLNNNDAVIYKRGYDFEKKEEIAVPDAFLSEILRNIIFLKDHRPIGGIIHSKDLGLALITVREVLKTDGSGPSGGTIIFARIIDDAVLNDARKAISVLQQANFYLLRAYNGQIFSSSVLNKLSAKEVFIDNKTDKSKIYGYSYIADIFGRNDLILKVEIQRDPISFPLFSFSFFVNLLIIAIFSILVFAVIMNKLIVKKITYLVRAISGMETGQFGVKDIILPGKDELSFLSEKMSAALDEVIKIRKKIVLRNEELEKSQKAILNVLEDIQDEKSKSDLLVADLQKFKLAVDNVSDLIIITDREGVILYANKIVELITGYQLSEIIGNKPSLWGKQMPKKFYENFWETIKFVKKTFIGEITNKRKDGEKYVAEIKVSPILNSKGDIAFFVGIERDITKIKELDAAKSEFVSVASHQLKTPISSIKWLMEALLQNKEKNLNEKQLIALKKVYESNEKMIALINDLLSISRIDTGKFSLLNLERIKIVPLIRRIVKSLGKMAKERRVELEFKDSLPENYYLSIDKEKMYQVILNLISNAIGYSKLEGGKVEIAAETRNGEFVFSVKDNGIGIPIQSQRRIFEKFFRADNAILTRTSGTGLGLYITKYFIEKHGGKIWFKSKENAGTTFYFLLKQT